FTPAAAEKLVEMAQNAKKPVMEFCEAHFADFQFGLDLVKRANGETEFKLNALQVLNPQQTVANWMKAIKE
ncbi:MAG: hypothetical protein J6S21_06500, partial [Victivallales bacterium]|nr:hypothetical protein [Victivallales bacterium]